MTDKQPEALAADHSGDATDMVGRWYMLNKMGMATLCANKADAQQEAADAQRFWPHMGPHRAVQLVEAADVEAMRAGYDAARLEIESLRARSLPEIKDMHNGPQQLNLSDRAMWVLGWNECRDAARDADRAMRAAQPENMHCKSTQKRLATQWGFVPAGAQQPSTTPQADSQPAVDALAEAEYFIDNPSAWSNFDQRASDAIAAVCKAFRAARAPADSVTAPVGGWHPFPHYLQNPDGRLLRTSADMLERHGYTGCSTPLRRMADALLNEPAAATPPTQVADSVLEDAAQVEIDLFNDLNRIYGNTLTAYAKEMCRLGYRKTNAARKKGANHDQ